MNLFIEEEWVDKNRDCRSGGSGVYETCTDNDRTALAAATQHMETYGIHDKLPAELASDFLIVGLIPLDLEPENTIYSTEDLKYLLLTRAFRLLKRT